MASRLPSRFYPLRVPSAQMKRETEFVLESLTSACADWEKNDDSAALYSVQSLLHF